MRAPVAFAFAVTFLLSFLSLVTASSPSRTDTQPHSFALVKRAACTSKACLTVRYIAQSKEVTKRRLTVAEAVASQKKINLLLKRSLKGGEKNATQITKLKKQSSAAAKALDAPPSPGSSRTSAKKGLCYNVGGLTKAFTDRKSVSWHYNWDQTSQGVAPGVEFVPMLWGPSHASTWSKNAQAAIKDGAAHLLGRNEPDLASQSNMDVASAVKLWKKEMLPFASKAKLVSPAVTGTLEGIDWLRRFVKECAGCKISAAAVHWYDRADNFAWLQLYLEKVKALGLPIWITEFAPSGSVAQQQAFYEQAIPWLENESFIERYAAFGAFKNNLVTADGSLTPVGRTYADTVA